MGLYSTNGFREIEILEESFTDIQREFLTLDVSEFEPYPESELVQKGSWLVYAFDYERDYPEHKLRCPKTAEALSKIPNRLIAGFSLLAPQTEIALHAGGIHPNILRLHLGLSIPEGDTALKVESTQVKWTEGKVLAFLDRLNHCAWNRTSKYRAVLIVDIPEPGCRVQKLNLVR